MKLSRQFQAFFFYEKISHLQKHSQPNINQQNKIKQTLNNKGNSFSPAKSFHKKKKKKTGFNIRYQHPMRNFTTVPTHLTKVKVSVVII